MKSKDFALIGVIAFIAAIISLFVSKAIFVSSSSRQQVEVVQSITSDFPQPDSHYFNGNAYDPTKLITISPNSNNNPFQGN